MTEQQERIIKPAALFKSGTQTVAELLPHAQQLTVMRPADIFNSVTDNAAKPLRGPLFWVNDSSSTGSCCCGAQLEPGWCGRLHNQPLNNRFTLMKSLRHILSNTSRHRAGSSVASAGTRISFRLADTRLPTCLLCE